MTARARKKDTCVVMIDAANIDSGFEQVKKRAGNYYCKKLDYNKLVSAIVPLGVEIFEKSIYVATADLSDSKWKGFVKFLKAVGFRPVTKEVKVIKQDDGPEIRKANFDVEIATDASSYAWRRDCNEIIIVSGDSDFDYLLKKISDLDVKVTVVSTKASLSKELKNVCDRLILLDDLNIEDIIKD